MHSLRLHARALILLLAPCAIPASGQCLVQEIVSPTPSAFGQFGQSFAFAGDQLLVGADGDAGFTGAVHVFEEVGGVWTAVQKITASDAQGGARYGIEVAVSGDRALVGASFADDVGAAYVLERTAGVWSEVVKLQPVGLSDGVDFGSALAIDGDRLVVAAPGETVSGVAAAGKVFVHELLAGSWTLTAELSASQPFFASYFGSGVDLAGPRLAVGSPGAAPNGMDTGAVYVFENGGTGWSEDAVLTEGADVYSNADLGECVALEGGRLFAGMPFGDEFEPGDGGCDSGSVAVYELGGSGWSLAAELTAGAAGCGTRFGRSLAAQGDRVLVGNRSGFAALFERRAAGWVQLAEISDPDPDVVTFSIDVGLDGERIALSSIDGIPNLITGRVLVYDTADPVGASYCSTNANSTGVAASIEAIGSSVVADDCFHLIAVDLPPDEFGYFLASLTPDFVPGPGGSQGNLCLGGTIGRFAQQVQWSGPSGSFATAVELVDLPPPLDVVMPGDTWRFQAWFRDLNPNPTSNFTDGVEVTFL